MNRHPLVRNVQKGFTLIELMIVLAIIGLLVTYGLPKYQDYVVRTKVTEGLALATSAKTAVVENAANGTPFDSGWTPPAATKNVQSIAINKDAGFITITYDASLGEKKTLILTPLDGSATAGTALKASVIPTSGSITWICASATGGGGNTAVQKGSIEDKYVPANCREAAPPPAV